MKKIAEEAPQDWRDNDEDVPTPPYVIDKLGFDPAKEPEDDHTPLIPPEKPGSALKGP